MAQAPPTPSPPEQAATAGPAAHTHALTHAVGRYEATGGLSCVLRTGQRIAHCKHGQAALHCNLLLSNSLPLLSRVTE